MNPEADWLRGITLIIYNSIFRLIRKNCDRKCQEYLYLDLFCDIIKMLNKLNTHVGFIFFQGISILFFRHTYIMNLIKMQIPLCKYD